MRLQSEEHGLDINKMKFCKKIIKEEILVLNKGCREKTELAQQLYKSPLGTKLSEQRRVNTAGKSQRNSIMGNEEIITPRIVGPPIEIESATIEAYVPSTRETQNMENYGSFV